MEQPATAAPAPANTHLTERARIAAILNSPEAEGREQLARTIALESDLDPDAARKLLASAPVPKPQTAFHAAMAAVENPKVGADAAPDDDASEVRRILAVHNSMRRN